MPFKYCMKPQYQMLQSRAIVWALCFSGATWLWQVTPAALYHQKIRFGTPSGVCSACSEQSNCSGAVHWRQTRNPGRCIRTHAALLHYHKCVLVAASRVLQVVCRMLKAGQQSRRCASAANSCPWRVRPDSHSCIRHAIGMSAICTPRCQSLEQGNHPGNGRVRGEPVPMAHCIGTHTVESGDLHESCRDFHSCRMCPSQHSPLPPSFDFCSTYSLNCICEIQQAKHSGKVETWAAGGAAEGRQLHAAAAPLLS